MDDDREQLGTTEADAWREHVPEGVRQTLDRGPTEADATEHESQEQQQASDELEAERARQRAQDVATMAKRVGATEGQGEQVEALVDAVAEQRAEARRHRLGLIGEQRGLSPDEIDAMTAAGVSGSNAQEIAGLLKSSDAATRESMARLLRDEASRRR